MGRLKVIKKSSQKTRQINTITVNRSMSLWELKEEIIDRQPGKNDILQRFGSNWTNNVKKKEFFKYIGASHTSGILLKFDFIKINWSSN